MSSSLAQLEDMVAPERLRPLRRVEYEQLVGEGLFHDERIELLRGVIVAMSPRAPRHAATVQRLTSRLAIALAGKAEVRVQLPLAVADDSLPEPDVAVVAPGDYDQAHPTTAFLVVEVSDSSLNKDRSRPSSTRSPPCPSTGSPTFRPGSSRFTPTRSPGATRG